MQSLLRRSATSLLLLTLMAPPLFAVPGSSPSIQKQVRVWAESRRVVEIAWSRILKFFEKNGSGIDPFGLDASNAAAQENRSENRSGIDPFGGT